MPKVEIRHYTELDEPFAGVWSLHHFDDALASALEVYEILKGADKDGSPRQHAAISLFPTGLSIAFSVRELLRQAYIGSARILARPLLERVATLSYVVNQPDGPERWSNGWLKNGRYTLAVLMEKMVDSNPHDAAHIRKMISDFNALVHVSREESDLFLAVDPDGELGYSAAQTPREFDHAENVSAMGMFSVSFLASDARRAMMGWPGVFAKP